MALKASRAACIGPTQCKVLGLGLGKKTNSPGDVFISLVRKPELECKQVLKGLEVNTSHSVNTAGLFLNITLQ